MKIAEIIQSGIPKVGETYISSLPCKDLWSSPMTQKRQVIGYHNFHGLLIIDIITDYYKILKIISYKLLEMLKRMDNNT